MLLLLIFIDEKINKRDAVQIEFTNDTALLKVVQASYRGNTNTIFRSNFLENGASKKILLNVVHLFHVASPYFSVILPITDRLYVYIGCSCT